jgi:AcrR family transcriptional regulator
METSPNIRKDRRRQRTRQLLRESLIALILERGYDGVTIQDITNRANLGRATFYLHYADKEELLLTMLQEVVDGLLMQIEMPTLDNVAQQSPPVLMAFQHAATNRDLYRAMLGTHSSHSVMGRLRMYLSAALQKQAYPMQSTVVPIEVVCTHTAGGILSLISWWIENDTTYSAEQIAAMAQQINLFGVVGALYPDKLLEGFSIFRAGQKD